LAPKVPQGHRDPKEEADQLDLLERLVRQAHLVRKVLMGVEGKRVIAVRMVSVSKMA